MTADHESVPTETDDDDDDAIVTVHALSRIGQGFVAAIELSAEAPGVSTARLARFNDDADPVETLAEHPLKGGEVSGALPVLARLPASNAPLSAWYDGQAAHVDALDPALEKAADALAGAVDGAICQIACDGRFMAVLSADGTMAQSLSLVNLTVRKPGPKPVDLSALGLSGMRVITAMALWNGGLYVAVSDPVAGFEVHRISPTRPGSRIARVIERGGFRFALNAAVTGFCPAPDGLLIGTAALASGTDTPGNWGPEMLQLGKDHKLGIIFGQQRFTPDGLKRPASGLGPGLGAPQNGAVKAICRGKVAGKERHVVILQDYFGDPIADRAKVRPDMMSYDGDARIFWSRDLNDWTRLDIDLPADFGAITDACLTANGLVIGHEGLGSAAMPLSFARIP